MSITLHGVGVFFWRHKGIVACVFIAATGYIVWPQHTVTTSPDVSTPPEVAALEAVVLEEVSPPSVKLKTTTQATTEAKDPCDSGGKERYLVAKKLVASGDPDAAFDILFPCQSTQSAEAKALYGQLIAITVTKRAKFAADEAKRLSVKKKAGVSLGMTSEDVLKSGWGKPKAVNRTTNIYGVSEQWVYDGGNLYFENGTLTAVQN
jgi:hypothetical protein